MDVRQEHGTAMKIFLDTAQVDIIKQYAPTGLIDGVTTNPSLLSKIGGQPLEVIKQIIQALPHGDISVEITYKEPGAVYAQAQAIAALGDNVVVKIPCHQHYYQVIHKLVQDGIRINITLLFSLAQALVMSKLGVEYISLIVGRLDDVNSDGIAVARDICLMLDRYGFETQLLLASIRSVARAQDAMLAGADAMTIPPVVFEAMMQHSLTDRGIALFDADWQKLGITQFP
jgi:transaldolase